MSFPAITLRYFNCHGRVQHLRYYLLARGINFTDERVELDENWASWQAIKNDSDKTGPFHKLPVMEWGDLSLSESSVIHDWLHQQSGDAEALDEEQNLQHAMLCSSCNSELMMAMGMLLWVEISHAGVNFEDQVKATLPKVKDHLGVLEETLNQWDWWENLTNRQIMLADCLLWQQLLVASQLFGAALELETFTGLAGFYQHCSGREVFETLIDDFPMQLTGRAEEQTVIKRIREIVN